MFKKLLTLCTLHLALCTLSGCGPFWVDPYITVQESSLNWVIIHYYNMNRQPIRRIGVEIRGNGLVEVKKGTSELVSNDFAKRYKDENWGNVKTHRIQIDPKDANDIFQNLVNYGLLDREKTGKRSKKTEFKRVIGVKANICNYTYSEQVNIFEPDPFLPGQDVQGGDLYPYRGATSTLGTADKRLAAFEACRPAACWHSPQCIFFR